MFAKISRGFLAIFFKDRLERQLDAELRFHLEMETQKNIGRGMSPHGARCAALRNFGGVELIKDRCRDLRPARLIEELWQDVQYGCRALRKKPGFTITALLTLAVGIGANTAIFSVIYSVLVKPLPYHEGDRLVVIRQQARLAGLLNVPFSVKEIDDFKQRSSTLQDLAEFHSMSFILLGGEQPQRVQTGVVSANFFDLLGVKPLLGRTFTADDARHGAEAVLVLSYNYWQQQCGGEAGIVGKQFRMNDRAHTVIGVLPMVPQYPSENDVYMPVSACPVRSSEGFQANRTARMMSVIGRVKAGVSVEEAEAEMKAIAEAMAVEHRDAYPESRGHTAAAVGLREELVKEGRAVFLVLLGSVMMVLMIACTNVANLMMSRMKEREREMEVRAALGASRRRLMRQVVTESVMMSVGGGVIGVLVAQWSTGMLREFAGRYTTRAGEIEVDEWVLMFAVVMSVATGVCSGVMGMMGVGAGAAVKEGERIAGGERGRRVRGVLVVSQVAVSFMLLIGAGLMMRSMYKLQQVDPGFRAEKVLVMRISPNWSKYTNPDSYRSLYQQLLDKVKAEPHVISAAVASTYPLNPLAITYGPWNRTFHVEGQDFEESDRTPIADFRAASPDYFQTVGVALIRGRVFTEGDDERAPLVAVINESMARHRWGGEEPIGKRVSFDRGQTWVTIVGIVGDVKQYGLDTDPADELYVPLAQNPSGGGLLVRTAAEPMRMVERLRQVVHEVDPETAVAQAQTLDDAKSESLAPSRLTTILLCLFAAISLIITTAGIVGVMALSVSRRKHEIGIRMALGATRAGVLRLIMASGMKLALTGLLIGIVGAVALTRLMKFLLFGIQTTDLLTYVAVSALLMTAAAVSCFLPAHKAATIDPMTVLKSE